MNVSLTKQRLMYGDDDKGNGTTISIYSYYRHYYHYYLVAMHSGQARTETQSNYDNLHLKIITIQHLRVIIAIFPVATTKKIYI